ncbi:E3 ubiquitin-protein ligase rnf8 isoform X2 [Scleropages formosus]|uniref:E3 ubiquitin-protein ligase rnf8 isoform X2 n=1 Tax=Scleropages formosus TaxID=113540 RepID=UPI000879151F|nr:E3 ubiquitin-protein ligase RNF8 isoform X2 [Scleropages formosus]
MERQDVPDSSAVDDCNNSEDEEIWCLKRVGRDSEWLCLHDNTEVTLGRGMNVTYQILSLRYPLMISRNHCAFKQNSDGQWTVTDNKSLNGVWVNGERIQAEKAVQLNVGDSIKLGVPVDGMEVEFEYILLRDSLRTVKPFLHVKLAAEDDAASKTRKSKRKFSMEETESPTALESKSKLYRSSTTDKSLGLTCPVEEATQQSRALREAAGPSGTHLQPQPGSDTSAELARLQQYNHSMQVLKSKLLDTELQAATLQAKHPAREEEMAKLQEQLNMMREQLNCQREQQIQRVQILEESFYKEEKRLEMEKKQLQEDNLKKQLEETLLEHRKVMEELKCCRRGFEEIIQAKDKELEETKEEKEKARAQKEEVVTQMTEVLENELQCIICSELFIEAVTLNCAHSFCLHCIGEWRKRKDECPICRQVIASQTRSLVLDNCIDRMVDNLSVEMKERRQALISQRKAPLVAVEVVQDDDSHSNSSSFWSSSPMESSYSGSGFLSSGFTDNSSEQSLDSTFMSSVLSQEECSSSCNLDSFSFSDSSIYFSDSS